jgi:hypothetical protein
MVRRHVIRPRCPAFAKWSSVELLINMASQTGRIGSARLPERTFGAGARDQKNDLNQVKTLTHVYVLGCLSNGTYPWPFTSSAP